MSEWKNSLRKAYEYYLIPWTEPCFHLYLTATCTNDVEANYFYGIKIHEEYLQKIYTKLRESPLPTASDTYLPSETYEDFKKNILNGDEPDIGCSLILSGNKNPEINFVDEPFFILRIPRPPLFLRQVKADWDQLLKAKCEKLGFPWEEPSIHLFRY